MLRYTTAMKRQNRMWATAVFEFKKKLYAL